MSRRLNYVQDYSVLYNNAVRPVTIVNMRVTYMPTLPIYAVVYRFFKSSTAYRS